MKRDFSMMLIGALMAGISCAIWMRPAPNYDWHLEDRSLCRPLFDLEDSE